MLNIDWQEHDCTQCGFNLIIERHVFEEGPDWIRFQAPVLGEDGEVADVAAVENCLHCGAVLADQIVEDSNGS